MDKGWPFQQMVLEQLDIKGKKKKNKNRPHLKYHLL